MELKIAQKSGLAHLLARHHDVCSIELGSETCWQQGRLTVSAVDVAALCGSDLFRIRELQVAAPGESMRMGPVLDVTCMASCAEGPFFGGISGQTDAGTIRHIDVLDNAGLCIVASVPGVQEGIIEMSGPWSPLANMHLLVCVLDVAEGQNRMLIDAAIRQFQCRLAESLASVVAESEPAKTIDLRWPPEALAENLPKVGAVYFVQSQGCLRSTFFLGQPVSDLDVQLINPLDVMAGGLVSGNFVLPANKTCTLIHQSAPVISRLMRHHGREWNMGGVILACENSDLQAKHDTARKIAAIASELGLDGVIINQEGGGNSDMDLMLACRELEKANIMTVLMANEFAGADGSTPPLTEFVEEARSIVSTGNNEHVVDLPKVDKFVGFNMQILDSSDPKASLSIPLSRIYASTNQLGFASLSCAAI